MRYIGCKERIMQSIDSLIKQKCIDAEGGVFCDIFAGTGTVGSYFKNRFQIIANDYLFFSYCISGAFIINNNVPLFPKLKKFLGTDDVFDYLENAPLPDFISNNYFITQNYSDYNGNSRLYLTESNARRIDFIRSSVDDWKRMKLISEKEYIYILGCLLYSVPSYSNVTGTYGAFLKYWDKRCFKRYELQRIKPFNNHQANQIYNEDSNRLISKLRGDILYIDPPYNSRDYLSNYHLLETIAKNDSPLIRGVTGIRVTEEKKSAYCSKKNASTALSSLVHEAKFRHIVVSYNSEGLLTKEEIISILKKECLSDSVDCIEVDIKRYQSKKTDSKKVVVEYLFYGKKDIPPTKTPKQIDNKGVASSSTKYIKSPTNYIGGKWRLLDQLLPLFPTNISSFVDLFAGGLSVTANVKAKEYYANDINYKIIDMFEEIIKTPINELLNYIDQRISQYGLSKTNEDAFLQFRDDYNRNQNPIDLFILSCFSFNYQFRFNAKGEYNNPFGKNRSSYTKVTEKKLISFKNVMDNKRVVFSSKDFRKFDLLVLDKNSFIYCDPPYLLTTGSYNDGKRCFGDWLYDDEKDLLSFLDRANDLGIRFALSEITIKNDRRNELLLNWAKKYNVYKIYSNYSNCNYQSNDKESKTVEVLVTNYE